MTVLARSEGGNGSVAGRLNPENSITPGQLELLSLYASGYSYEQIGSMKFRSPFTVRNTLLATVRRAGARNLTHLCAAIVEAGMIRQNAAGIYEPITDLRIAESE